MDENEWLAERFDAHRSHLRAVAYRMLGSMSEADDAVQGTWLRLTRSHGESIENLGGWLTTAVARECLDMLRSRRARREDALGVHIPDPILSRLDGPDPEEEILVADSVGLALLVVMERLAPAERIAFVLHDVFAMPYSEIAPIVGRSGTAARQLASRARRRVRSEGAVVENGDVASQAKVIKAFLAAARSGDFDGLLEVLDPDVVVRADSGGMPGGISGEIHGSEEVANQALLFSRRLGRFARLVLVNGAPGVVAVSGDRLRSVMGFTVRGKRIVAIDILADPDRLRRVDLAFLDE
jgi:RNA polymerase sigma-70 factor (ECF subfamily)